MSVRYLLAVYNHKTVAELFSSVKVKIPEVQKYNFYENSNLKNVVPGDY